MAKNMTKIADNLLINLFNITQKEVLVLNSEKLELKLENVILCVEFSCEDMHPDSQENSENHGDNSSYQ